MSTMTVFKDLDPSPPGRQQKYQKLGMESVKKWLSERTVRKNGLYVHYSPPKLLEVVSAAQLRQWARGGEANKLERAVLAGQGHRLLAETDALPLSSHLPTLVAKCDALHHAVERGSLLELQELLESDYNRRKHVLCCDEAGTGLLHKAVYYDYMDITEWLVKHYPQLVNQRDSEGRTPLHYAAACRDAAVAAALLERAGAARGARDARGRTPAHYRHHARTPLALPALAAPRDMAHDTRHPPGLVIKRHNIRIWCHDCDMARLQRVVWEGHGTRLLSEVSNQPLVKKFLEAVPYMMNTIRDIHSAVVQNDLEGLMKHAGDPVPPQILSSRDSNNMTVMHKAAGLGHGGILGYIADRYPQGINDVDNDGRTPLHYAAAVRDDQHMYNTLVTLGADEGAVDNKNRTPGYYVNRAQEIDKNMLKTLPDAPRTPSSAYPANWDWKILDTEPIVEVNKKSKRKNFKASTENISSKYNSNSISENTHTRRGGMKASSTQEFIKELPDLDDNNKRHNGIIETNKDSEVVEEVNKEEDEEKNAEPENEVNPPEAEKDDEEKTPKTEGERDDDIPAQTEKIHEPDEDENEDIQENHIENENALNSDTIKHDEDINEQENKENIVEDDELKQEPDAESQQEENNELVSEDGNHEQDEQQKDEVVEQETNKQEDDPVDNRGQEDHDDDLKEEKETEISNNHDSTQDNGEITEDPTGTQEGNKHNTHVVQDLMIYEERNSYDDENKNDIDNKNQAEEGLSPQNEGNNRNEHSEDDDDVQVQGDTHSEYSEIHLRSTAEANDTESAKRGNESNGRNTQESLIEGIVSGEADQDSQDASIAQKDDTVHGEILALDSEIDPEVADLINTANMEMLATLVLNGEGSRLVGRRSGNQELQSFIDMVPSYMHKINKVHLAARDGNIRDLQAALDRRKFAIARDPVSPNGATPLHVATVFGKTNIMKYLGGRFPETLSAVDFEGRTALHYTAVLPDNGHYYNLLQQLGANTKDLDDNGRSAEDYLKDPSLLPFSQLLADFGISEEAAQKMLSDKGTARAANGDMDIPVFKTDEGRYLAKSLGDPLIKGLTEVANVKPQDPVAFLASFLHNFPEHEKPLLGTQETNVIVREVGEVDNEEAAPEHPEVSQPLTAARSAARTATRPHRPIDVVTVDPQPEVSPDAPEVAFSSVNRDEHGQSMLHFAAARSHTRNALFQLLQESDISLGYRDELYRTARDVSVQANIPENTSEVDRWVLHLAARGYTEKMMQLLIEGYDHILDVVDEDGAAITDVVAQRDDPDMSNLLASIPAFEESREALHGAVRRGDLAAVQEALEAEGGRTLARGQNTFGRTALHVAVLAQHEDIVAYLAQSCPALLRIGDNLERTPLHYAMGVEKIESLSRLLIRAGAKRVLKDLKGRQPTYYFMNKSDILRLKEEEEVY